MPTSHGPLCSLEHCPAIRHFEHIPWWTQQGSTSTYSVFKWFITSPLTTRMLSVQGFSHTQAIFSRSYLHHIWMMKLQKTVVEALSMSWQLFPRQMNGMLSFWVGPQVMAPERGNWSCGSWDSPGTRRGETPRGTWSTMEDPMEWYWPMIHRTSPYLEKGLLWVRDFGVVSRACSNAFFLPGACALHLCIVNSFV